MFWGNDSLVHASGVGSNFTFNSPIKKFTWRFAAPSNTNLVNFYFRMGSKTGSPVSPSCSIQLDSSGSPSGVELAIVTPTLGASNTWVTCTFNYALISGNVYWIVISGGANYDINNYFIILNDYINQSYDTRPLISHFSYGPPYRDHNALRVGYGTSVWSNLYYASAIPRFQISFNSYKDLTSGHSAVYDNGIGGATSQKFRVGGAECIKYSFYINTAFFSDKLYLGAHCIYRSIGDVVRRPTQHLRYSIYKGTTLCLSSVFCSSANTPYSTLNPASNNWYSTPVSYLFSTGQHSIVLYGTPTPNTSTWFYSLYVNETAHSQKNYSSFQGATAQYFYSLNSGKSWVGTSNKYGLPFKFSVRAIIGTTKSFDNKIYAGCKVIVNQTTTHPWTKYDITDASGYYQIPLTRAWHNGIKVKKYDYDFATVSFAIDGYSSTKFNSNYNTVVPLWKSTSNANSYWWSTQDNGKPTSPGMNYVYREKITFGNSHDRYNTSAVINFNIKTGYLKECPAINLTFNRAIQSSYFVIDHYSDKTHIIYLSNEVKLNGAYYGWNVKGITYDHINNYWLSTNKVVTTLSVVNDDHYAPSMCIDKNGYIHILYNCHDTNMYYMKSANPNSLESWDQAYQLNKVQRATYPRPYVGPDNSLWVFYRHRTGGAYSDSYWCVVKKSSNDSTITGWHTALFICKFMDSDSAPAGKNKKVVYSVGNYVDNDGSLHIAPVFTNGYSQGTHDLGVGYFYSTSNGVRWNDLKKNQPWAACATVAPVGNVGISSIPGPYSYSTVALVIRGTCNPSLGTRQYGGNMDAMCVHPIEIATAGLKRPFFLFNSYATASPLSQTISFQLSKWDRPNKNWINHTVNASDKKVFSGGSVGFGLVYGDDKLYTNYCYAESSSKSWGGGPIMLSMESANKGSSWNSRIVSGHNGSGLIRPCLKRNYSNKLIESVIQIGNKFYYAKDYKDFPYIRTDGEDFRIVHKGIEIDRVGDIWNVGQTNIQFKVQYSVATNLSYSTTGNYYIYYGNE